MEAVANAVNRQDLDKMEEPGGEFLPENISPCHEDDLPACRENDRQGVHQGILVVGGKDDRLAGRYFPAVFHNEPPVIKPVENGSDH